MKAFPKIYLLDGGVELSKERGEADKVLGTVWSLEGKLGQA